STSPTGWKSRGKRHQRALRQGPFHTCGEDVERLENTCKSALSRLWTGREILIEWRRRHCYARPPVASSEGVCSRGGAANRAVGGRGLERRRGSAARGPQRHDLPDVVRAGRGGKDRR